MRISDWSSDVCSSDLAVTRPLRAAVVAVVLALLGSACSVLNAENIPVATGVEDPYSITVFFPDALNLANGAAVKIDGATVGRVQEVSTENFEAKVSLDIDGRTRLPQDTTFRLRPTTALGQLSVAVISGDATARLELGRAACWGRVCKSVKKQVVA